MENAIGATHVANGKCKLATCHVGGTSRPGDSTIQRGKA